MNPLSFSYWFNFRPEPYGGWLLYLMLAVSVLFLVSAVINFYSGKKRILPNKTGSKKNNKLSNFFIANTIVAWLLLFFNHEQVPMLMARFWYLLWWLLIIIWLIFLLRFWEKMSQKKLELQKQKEFKKYLPR